MKDDLSYFKISAEALGDFHLSLPIQYEIEDIQFDKETKIATIYVSGENIPQGKQLKLKYTNEPVSPEQTYERKLTISEF